MEKFTRGEWVVDEYGDVIIKGSGGRVGHPTKDGVIASLDYGEYIENCNDFDAYLIAAAPKMYALLNEITEEVNDYENSINKPVSWAERAELLLAEARGE